ncbi:unnamed protein product [Effrenium voratum]|nr:unnamed protein product [Effrenium voratum]CAJ1448740.1 unnamed protein product [Effrenium voratum]
MKFGKEIRRHAESHVRYRNFYLNYKELKRLIKSPDPAKVARIRELLRHQLAKVDSFAQLQAETISGEARYMLQRQYYKPGRLDTLLQDYIELFRFWNINQLGFRKICKKLDKKLQDGFSKWFLPMVESASFRSTHWDFAFRTLGQLHVVQVPRSLTEGTLRDEVILVPKEDIRIAQVILGSVCLGPEPCSEPRSRGKVRTYLLWLDAPELPQRGARWAKDGTMDKVC